MGREREARKEVLIVAQRISGYKRVVDEVYETPPWVTKIVVEGFLRTVTDDYQRGICGRIWDPCNGPHSKLAHALSSYGFDVVATAGDFLAHRTKPDGVSAIVTNPPYGFGGRLGQQIIEHALSLASVVAMLMKVDYDSGRSRTSLFRDCPSFAGKIVLL